MGLAASSTSAKSAISKAWRRLEDLHLIRRERAGNRSRVVLLDEAGLLDDAGKPIEYVHPADNEERYLKLPYAYWNDRWHLRIDLPAKVALLIALSLDDAFPLPAGRACDWYGISADTAQRGLQALQGEQLLDVDERYKPEALSETGWVIERRYTLRPPFGPLRKATATITKLRT
jgi:hypothetical protein